MLSLYQSQPKTSPASPVSAFPVPTTDDSNEAHTNTKERITVRETLKGSDITAFRLYLPISKWKMGVFPPISKYLEHLGTGVMA